MMSITKVLIGKIICKGIIRSKTGLHIGGSKESLEVGGIDNPVLREPITQEPYIPGSSIKGKFRSLLEKYIASTKENPENFFNRDVGRHNFDIYIHVCPSKEEASNCPVCRVYGSSAGKDAPKNSNFPGRLKVRDAYLTPYTRKKLIKEETEALFTEIKYENALDRITAAANPRQIERVPRNSDFFFEIVYDVENMEHIEDDLKNLGFVFTALEDDALGGYGSRGYGKVSLSLSEIIAKKSEGYKEKETDKYIQKVFTSGELVDMDKPPDDTKMLKAKDFISKVDEIVNFFKKNDE